MARTVYTVIADSTATEITKSKKEAAVAEAVRLLKSKAAIVVEVRTGAGTVVFTQKRRNVTVFTAPYTKEITLTEDLQKAVPAGYAPAYARYRNGAVVLRRETDEVEDPSRYAVLSVAQKEIVGYAPTTRAAGALMKEMGKVRAAARA